MSEFTHSPAETFSMSREEIEAFYENLPDKIDGVLLHLGLIGDVLSTTQAHHLTRAWEVDMDSDPVPLSLGSIGMKRAWRIPLSREELDHTYRQMLQALPHGTDTKLIEESALWWTFMELNIGGFMPHARRAYGNLPSFTRSKFEVVDRQFWERWELDTVDNQDE